MCVNYQLSLFQYVKEHRDFLFRTANLHTIFEGSMALKRAFSDILQPSLKFSFILRFSLVRA